MYTRYHAGFTFAVPFEFSFLEQNSYYIRKMYSLMHACPSCNFYNVQYNLDYLDTLVPEAGWIIA